MERMQKQTKPKALAWSWPSHVAVFVRNLQLLKLDQQPDWPGITVRSLSPSSQNQRQRTKAVEWALYHLCAIWDPAVTQDVCMGLRPSVFHVRGEESYQLTPVTPLETPSVFPTVGSIAVGQSPGSAVSRADRSEEEW